MKKLNKKASIQDIVMFAIVIFFLAVISLIGYKVYDSFNTELQGNFNDTLGINESRYASESVNNMFGGILDNAFLFFMIGLGIVAFVLASLVRVNPVFLIFFVIVLIIIIFISAIFSNIYGDIASDPNFVALADDLIFMSHVMQFLPFIVGILGSVLAIVMYKGYKDEV